MNTHLRFCNPLCTFALLCVVSFSTASCALLKHPYAQALENMKGGDIQLAISRLGEPGSTAEHRFIRRTWQTRREVDHAGYWTTRTETSEHYDKEGRKVVTTTEIPEYIEPWTEVLWCNTTIDATPEGVITSYQWDGNDCR